MTTIAHVVCDSTAAGAFLARWPQPYLPGDDTNDWYVTTHAGTKKVQRNRLTDEVYACSVLVSAGTSAFDVFSDTKTSPATGWAASTLTGLGMTWNGHDGSRHFADFTDTTVEDILRDGHNERTVRRWVHSKISIADTGNTQPIGTSILGHHVYLTYRADQPDVVELAVTISNASATVGTLGYGLKQTFATGGLFGTLGFINATLNVPAGWTALADRPLVAVGDPLPTSGVGYVSTAHAFPKKMWTTRRYVLYKNATSGAAQAAQDFLDLKGLGRATASGPRSYHTVRAYGSGKSLLPNLDLGYTSSNGTGFAAAKLDSAAILADIQSRLGSGVGGGPFTYGRTGVFHVMGQQTNPGGGGGDDIYPFQGILQSREYVKYALLYATCKLDGSGVALFDRTTGRPLTTRSFGDAYTALGVPNVVPDAQYLGRQPFPFYIQNDSGYEYRGAYLRYFVGWINPEWPPHYYDDNVGHYYPVLQATWPVAPRTLLDFRCNYRPLLEQVMRQTGVNGNGTPIFDPPYPFQEDAPFGGDPIGNFTLKDPEDAQHFIRMYAKLIPAIWLGCDLVAIDQLEMLDEFAALQWSEIGHAPVINIPQTGPGSTLNNLSLLRAYDRQIQDPGKAVVSIGRGEGWVAILAATHYAVMDPTVREAGYPAKGQKRRIELWHETIRIGALPNGATYKYTLADANNNGQQINAFGLPIHVYGDNPPPISADRRMMQIGLEMPIAIWALFCCGKQLQRTDCYPVVMNAFRGHTALVNLYTNYAGGDVTAWGPMKWAEVWSDVTPPGSPTPGQSAQRYGTGGGNPGFPNHVLMVEMAYRVQGAASILSVANYLGHHAPGFPNQTPATRGVQLLQDGSYRGEWNLGLLQLLLTQPGADVAVAAPMTSPSVTCTVSPNPAPLGGTVTFYATVTPGTNPPSTAIGVTLDVSPTGDVAPIKTMLDGGVSPDATAGDNVFTYAYDTTGIPAQRYLFNVAVLDGQGRTARCNVSLGVVAGSTDPQFVTVQAFPNPVATGGELVIVATVTPGTSPDSTGLSVEANLSLIGGSGAVPLLDDGVSPDVSAGDNQFTVGVTVDPGSVIGDAQMPIRVFDDQGRIVVSSFTVGIYQEPVTATDPQIIGYARSAPVVAGETATLGGQITPGSGGEIHVTADASSLGGGVLDEFEQVDSFTWEQGFDIPADTAPGIYDIPFTVTEDERSGMNTLHLEIVAPFVATDPQILPQSSPNPVSIGHYATFTATVVPGTGPDSTELAVTLDLSAIGLSAAFPLVDTGVAPDLVEDDHIFTARVFIGAAMTPGEYDITATVTDAQERTASKSFTFGIAPPPPPPPIPDHTVPAMFDTLTNGVARITEGSTGKVLRYIRSVANAPLLQANVDWFEVFFYDESGTSPEVAISSTGRLVGTTQNADGTLVWKTAVVVDGQSPSRAGHTFEYMVDANRVGLKGGRSYRMEVQFALIEPVIVTSLDIRLACDEAYSA